jgi:hypothetical protein
LTTTVNDIEHIEANSYTTFGIVKIFFQASMSPMRLPRRT